MRGTQELIRMYTELFEEIFPLGNCPLMCEGGDPRYSIADIDALCHRCAEITGEPVPRTIGGNFSPFFLRAYFASHAIEFRMRAEHLKMKL